MKVRAKFRVESRTEHVGGFALDLRAVSSGSEENKAFFKWTPNATIIMQTINTEAAAQFAPGKEIYVDFTPADEE